MLRSIFFLREAIHDGSMSAIVRVASYRRYKCRDTSVPETLICFFNFYRQEEETKFTQPWFVRSLKD